MEWYNQHPKDIPCVRCKKKTINGWCYDVKKHRLYCSKDCAYKDTGEYNSTKVVTTVISRIPNSSYLAEYYKENKLTRKIRLESNDLIDDIL